MLNNMWVNLYSNSNYFLELLSPLITQDQEHFDKLKLSVLNTDLIVDKLIFKDVQLTATNDDQYFVFEDVLYQVKSAQDTMILRSTSQSF